MKSLAKPIFILGVIFFTTLGVMFITTAMLSTNVEAQTTYPVIEIAQSTEILDTFNEDLEREFVVVQKKDFKVEY